MKKRLIKVTIGKKTSKKPPQRKPEAYRSFCDHHSENPKLVVSSVIVPA